jgi:hypothetical protein
MVITWKAPYRSRFYLPTANREEKAAWVILQPGRNTGEQLAKTMGGSGDARQYFASRPADLVRLLKDDPRMKRKVSMGLASFDGAPVSASIEDPGGWSPSDTNAELEEALKARGVEVASGLKKADLVAALESWEETNQDKDDEDDEGDAS